MPEGQLGTGKRGDVGVDVLWFALGDREGDSGATRGFEMASCTGLRWTVNADPVGVRRPFWPRAVVDPTGEEPRRHCCGGSAFGSKKNHAIIMRAY